MILRNLAKACNIYYSYPPDKSGGNKIENINIAMPQPIKSIESIKNIYCHRLQPVDKYANTQWALAQIQ